MIRALPGLNSNASPTVPELNGSFLVEVERANYRWQPQKPFIILRFKVLEPASLREQTFSARVCCSPRALWRLRWFLQDFAYDEELLSHEQIDERALVHLRGVVRTSAVRFRGGVYQTLEGFAPAAEWENFSCAKDDRSLNQVRGDDF